VRACAVLVAIGALPSGNRWVLGVSVSLSEAEVHWRDFLQPLKKRGMHGMKLVVSDAHEGLEAARKAIMPNVPWQRCQFHLMQNAMKYVPKVKLRKQVAQDLRSVFNARDLDDAAEELKRFVNLYKDTAPKIAAWAETNIPAGLSVLQLPARAPQEHRKSTARGCEPQTCSNAKTKNSNGEHALLRCSQTKLPY
jgi:putative transposase